MSDFYVNKVAFAFTPMKLLPVTYTDSLSYYEDICKIINSVNSNIEAINNLVEYVQGFELSNKAYVDSEIAKVNQTIATLSAKVDANFDTLEQLIKDSDDVVLSTLRGEIAELRLYVNTQVTTLRGEISKCLEDAKDYTDLQLTLFEMEIPNFKNLQVYNPVTEKNEYIEKVLQDIFIYNANGIYAQEFDELELTAEQFDNKLLSALQFDTKGKGILGFVCPIRNPYTGKMDESENVIYALIDPTRDDYTASEFDALLKDASVIDGMEISAYDFDFINKTIIL